MPITKLKNQQEILRRIGHGNPTRYPVDHVLHRFLPSRRAKQMAIAKQGYKELCEKIGDKAEELELNDRLKFTCFFCQPRGELTLMGILASYYDRRGILLWWEPKKGD